MHPSITLLPRMNAAALPDVLHDQITYTVYEYVRVSQEPPCWWRAAARPHACPPRPSRGVGGWMRTTRQAAGTALTPAQGIGTRRTGGVRDPRNQSHHCRPVSDDSVRSRPINGGARRPAGGSFPSAGRRRPGPAGRVRSSTYVQRRMPCGARRDARGWRAIGRAISAPHNHKAPSRYCRTSATLCCTESVA
jgi:hypothetical protein